MSKYHAVSSGMVTRQALPSITRQRGTTTGSANLMLYGAGKTYAIGTNTTFTDSSANNFTVTRNGDTIQATANPFTGSVYFDGTTGYLEIPNNAAFNLGSSNFTIEAWVYPTVSGTEKQIITKYNSYPTGFEWNLDILSSGVLLFNGIGTSYFEVRSTTTIPINTWTHVASVRNGATITIYINGVASGTVAAQTFQTTTANVAVGRDLEATGASRSFTGYISNVRVVKGTAVYTANFTPPTSPLTAITNTSLLLLAGQQAPFRDSSANAFTVTANGNAAGSGVEPPSFVPYAGSGYFDGTGDYLSIPDNAAFTFDGDFTIEAWVSKSSGLSAIAAHWPGIVATNCSWVLYTDANNRLGFSYGIGSTNASFTGTSTTVTANQWNHVAVSRSGTTVRLFVNGVQDATTGTVSGALNNSTANMTVGVLNTNDGQYLTGYMSNLRLVKGTAVYTANFTPPAAPLTAITNTSLLLLTNNVGPFIDTSTNGFPVLRNGDTVQTGFNPFSQASAGAGFFDGNGDYLRTPSNAALSLSGSDFTIEGWIYLTSYSPGYSGIYASALCGAANGGTSSGYQLTAIGTASSYTGINFYARSGGLSQVDITATQSLSLNTWYHIAVTKSGTTYRIFIGGVAVNTTTSSATWTDTGVLDIGQSGFPGYQYTMPGYISNFRVVKGTAVYTANFTPPTSPLTAITNTSLLLLMDNYSIVNSTSTNLPITISGGATISTTQAPTGMSSSMYFNSATSSYVQTPTSTAVNLSSGNYTVEGWYYLDMATYSSFDLIGRGIISDFLTNSNARWLVILNGSGKLAFAEQDAIGANTVEITDPSNSPLQQWVYFAAVKSGTTMYLFKNGTLVASGTSSVRTGFPGRLNVAQATVDTSYRGFFLGYISNIRVSKGTAIYTSSFTTPSAPLSLSVTVPNFVTNNIYGMNQIP